MLLVELLLSELHAGRLPTPSVGENHLICRESSAPASGGIARGCRWLGWNPSERFTWREITFARLTAAQILIEQTKDLATIWPQQQQQQQELLSDLNTQPIKDKEITHSITHTTERGGHRRARLMDYLAINWHLEDTLKPVWKRNMMHPQPGASRLKYLKLLYREEFIL